MKKSINKNLLITIAVIVSICLIITLSLLAPVFKYRHGLKCLEEKDFDRAIDTFTALGDYKDSKTQLQESKYQSGIADMESKNFDEAINTFTYLEDYKDSETQLKESKYRSAVNDMESEDFDKAQETFGDLNNYRDSAEKAKEAKYRSALKIITSGADSTGIREPFADTAAWKKLKELDNYKDSADYLKKFKYVIAGEEREHRDKFFGNGSSRTVYFYDKYGNLSSGIRRSTEDKTNAYGTDNKETTDTTVYSYQSTTNVFQELADKLEKIKDNVYPPVADYNNNGMPVRIYIATKDKITQYSYEYNDEGQVEREDIVRRYSGSSIHDYRTFKYDIYGNIAEIHESNSNSSQSVDIIKTFGYIYVQ